MKLSKRLLSIAAGVLGTALSATSYGATISYHASAPLATTNWSKELAVPLFDPALGTLNSISFEIEASVVSNISFESRDSRPATVFTSVEATVDLSRPDTSALMQTKPTISRNDSATAFDGTEDFGGTSGAKYLGVSATSSFMTHSSSAADLALFSGNGDPILLPVTVSVVSNATGSANLVARFLSRASADLTVTYDYTPSIPAPAAAWSGMAVLAGVVLARLRRRLGA